MSAGKKTGAEPSPRKQTDLQLERWAQRLARWRPRSHGYEEASVISCLGEQKRGDDYKFSIKKACELQSRGR